MRLTGITPNDQEYQDLDSEIDPVTQQHHTINRPDGTRKQYVTIFIRRLTQQILKSSRRKIEERESIITDVAAVTGPDLPASCLVLRVKLVGSNGLFVADDRRIGVGFFLKVTLTSLLRDGRFMGCFIERIFSDRDGREVWVHRSH